MHHLDKGQVVVLAGGTGNPFFTTDTAAVPGPPSCACRLKATQVDGVYSADPKDPNAIRFDRLTHDEAIAKDLKVMDTAAPLARESRLSIIVGSVHAPSSVTALLQGKVPHGCRPLTKGLDADPEALGRLDSSRKGQD